MKNLGSYMVWALVLGGLLWGYEGLTGTDLLEQVLGSQLEMVVDVVLGLAGVVVAYMLAVGKLTVKSK